MQVKWEAYILPSLFEISNNFLTTFLNYKSDAHSLLNNLENVGW